MPVIREIRRESPLEIRMRECGCPQCVAQSRREDAARRTRDGRLDEAGPGWRTLELDDVSVSNMDRTFQLRTTWGETFNVMQTPENSNVIGSLLNDGWPVRCLFHEGRGLVARADEPRARGRGAVTTVTGRSTATGVLREIERNARSVPRPTAEQISAAFGRVDQDWRVALTDAVPLPPAQGPALPPDQFFLEQCAVVQIPSSALGEVFEWMQEDFKVVGARRAYPSSRRIVVLATSTRDGRTVEFPSKEIAELFRTSNGPRSRGGTPRARRRGRRRT